MKYIILLFILLPFAGIAQKIGSPNSTVYVPGKFRLPLDTVTNAPEGSIAYKNGNIYKKTSTAWVAISGSGGASAFFDLSDVDSTSMLDGYIPYYDLATGNIMFQAPATSPGIPSTNHIFPVEDSTNTQPASPTDSTYWLTGGAPTGASGIWTSNPNKVLLYVSGTYSVPTQGVGDYAITTDTVIYHRYNGTTWPRSSPLSWNIGGVYGGGAAAGLTFGTLDATKVRLKYNGNNRILLDAAGIMMPTLGGAAAGVLGSSTTGRLSNLQPGYGQIISSTEIKPDSTLMATRAYVLANSGGGTTQKVYAPLVQRGDSISLRFNVLYYGAIPNDGIDDTQAFNDALIAADAVGGGRVTAPFGVYNIDGPLVHNCQIFIPRREYGDPLRGRIIIEGEAPTTNYPVGLGLGGDISTPVITGGVILISSLTSGAPKAAVIGTDTLGTSPNANELFVKNINIQVKNNPAGAGPVVGGINYRFGLALSTDYVNYYPDTSGFNTTLPTNDIAGIETPDNNATQNYSISNTFVMGAKSGFKVGEHVTFYNSMAACNYYGINFKAGSNTTTGVNFLSAWNKNDIYASGAVVLENFTMAVENATYSKWYDHTYTINDSLNQLTGNLWYKINGAGTFSQNGATALNIYQATSKLAQVNQDNVFTFLNDFQGPVKIAGISTRQIPVAGTFSHLHGTSTFTYDTASKALGIGVDINGLGTYALYMRRTNAYMDIDNSAINSQGGIIFSKSDDGKYSILMGYAADGTNDFAIRDMVNAKAKFYTSSTNGTVFIGNDAFSSPVLGLYNNGAVAIKGTITAGGTTGDQTINKAVGTVNIAASGTTVTVTNSLVTSSSLVKVYLRTNDTTAKTAVAVAGSGSFVVTLNAACTAEVSIGFEVINVL